MGEIITGMLYYTIANYFHFHRIVYEVQFTFFFF